MDIVSSIQVLFGYFATHSTYSQKSGSLLLLAAVISSICYTSLRLLFEGCKNNVTESILNHRDNQGTT